MAAGEGAIFVGPVGATPPKLDGGEWPPSQALTAQPRAGRGRLRRGWSARGKRRSQLVTKRNHWLKIWMTVASGTAAPMLMGVNTPVLLS